MKVLKLIRDPHFSAQILSQTFAPIIFQVNPSLRGAYRAKIFGDVIEFGCTALSGGELSLRKQPTNILVLGLMGLKRIIRRR